MKCPKCQEHMFAMEYDNVEIDVCDDCGGVWLDSGELETILGTSRAAVDSADLEAAAKAKGEALLDCPVCVSKLAKDAYGETDVIVDRCPHGDGVFLDRGELEAIRAHYATHADATASHEDLAGRLLKKFFSADDPPGDSRS